jgi:hypothetical protein
MKTFCGCERIDVKHRGTDAPRSLSGTAWRAVGVSWLVLRISEERG